MVVNRISPNALDSFGVKSPSRTDPIAAMKAAGGLFGLRKMPLSKFAGVPANDDLHVVTRTDTGQAIGTVGNSYETFDNEAFFAPTAKALIEETGARIDRFQMLDNGTRAFMRLSWPSDRNISIGRPKVGDIVGRRCVLSTSHDGKWAGKFSLQMLRLICSNGMVAPVGEYEFGLTHTAGGHQQLIDLRKMIPVIERFVRQFEVAANILVDTPAPITSDRTMKVIRKMVDPSDRAGEKKSGGANQAQERINRIVELFTGEQPGWDSPECKNTGWGLYQAGNHFFTHDKGTRGETADEKHVQRFKSLLPGGQANKEIVRAWEVVVGDGKPNGWKGLGIHDAIKAQVAAIN